MGQSEKAKAKSGNFLIFVQIDENPDGRQGEKSADGRASEQNGRGWRPEAAVRARANAGTFVQIQQNKRIRNAPDSPATQYKFCATSAQKCMLNHAE